MNTEELFPCPFCGGAAERIDFDDDTDLNWGGSCISCTACGASSAVHFGTKDNLYFNWNTRYSPSSWATGDDHYRQHAHSGEPSSSLFTMMTPLGEWKFLEDEPARYIAQNAISILGDHDGVLSDDVLDELK